MAEVIQILKEELKIAMMLSGDGILHIYDY